MKSKILGVICLVLVVFGAIKATAYTKASLGGDSFRRSFASRTLQRAALSDIDHFKYTILEGIVARADKVDKTQRDRLLVEAHEMLKVWIQAKEGREKSEKSTNQ